MSELPQSGRHRSFFAWRPSSFEEKMKPSRRRHIEKANTPKDIADQFRELQKLRIKVSEAEIAVAQKKAVDVENIGRRKRQ